MPLGLTVALVIVGGVLAVVSYCLIEGVPMVNASRGLLDAGRVDSAGRLHRDGQVWIDGE